MTSWKWDRLHVEIILAFVISLALLVVKSWPLTSTTGTALGVVVVSAVAAFFKNPPQTVRQAVEEVQQAKAPEDKPS